MKHLRKFNESFEDETKSYLETLFADISESGYYNVEILVTKINTGSIFDNQDIKGVSEVRLTPVEGKLWNRPDGSNAMVGFCGTSIEKESKLLEVKQKTLNTMNAIIEDIKSEGNLVDLLINRLGDIKVKINFY